MLLDKKVKKKRKIKNEIIVSIGTTIVILMLISTVIISGVINRNTRTYIENDMKIIIKYVSDSINNLNKSSDSNRFSVINKVSNLFNVYISLDKNYFEAVGEIILEEKINKYKDIEVEEKSFLNVANTNNTTVGTLYYPLYINGIYEGKLIMQKAYDDNFNGDKNLITGIILTEIIITLILLVGTYLIVSKITKPLETLAHAMRNFGQGEKVDKLEDKSSEEIIILSKEFNNMAKNIDELQSSTREFFDKATHELKTPLTAIKGYSQLLQDEYFQDEFTNRALERLELESVKMEGLVENLLILSREQRAVNREKEEVILEETLNIIIDSFRLRIKNNHIKIIKNINSQFKLYTVKEDLEILLGNLIDNSIKYTSSKTIKVKLIDNLLVIENTYNPLYMDLQSNLLEPFIKGEFKKGEVSSSGLGLYICKRICEKNNWNITYVLKEENIIEFKLILCNLKNNIL